MQLSFQKVNVAGINVLDVPIKNNKEYPLFDYEHILFNKLFVNEPNQDHSFKNKHLWC